MRIIERAVYLGPNCFSLSPMVRIRLDLQELEFWPTDRLPGFKDALLAALPGVTDHHCSLGEPGGFVRRLQEGTWLGHVAEHVALELQARAGHEVTRGKTRSVKGSPGVYDLVYAYRDAEVGLLAGLTALRLVDSLLPDPLRGLEDNGQTYGPFDLQGSQDELRRLVEDRAHGPTTAAIVSAAEARGIPVSRLDDSSLVRLGWGARQKLVRASITGETSLIAVETAQDKDLTKRLLDSAGVPTPRGMVVGDAEEAVRAAAQLGGSVVIKPLDGNQGKGVGLDLRTPEQVRWAFGQASRYCPQVVVEQQFVGRDYRILVVGGEAVAVAERTPACVVGDGFRTVQALIDHANRDPRRGDGHEKAMTRIKVDDHLREWLTRSGLSLDYIPPKGRAVQLRATANLSTGGEAVDRTDIIHPHNAAIAKRAAAVVGLDVAGIDFVCPNIASSAREAGGGVIEVNAAPGLRMHTHPSQGPSRDVGGAILGRLFPGGATGRIPVIAVSGTNGKSTTVRMASHIFRRQGLNVGFTTTSGVQVGDELVDACDASGPNSARMVLNDPTVEIAVLETARGGILREGLGFDRCDVGVLLNVAADHLGLKGVDTIEQLAEVKAIVTEAVRKDGVSLFNADDPTVLRMADRAGGRLAFFTMNGGEALSPLVQKHIALGGLAASVEPSVHGGLLVLHDGERRLPLLEADAIPATLEGLAAFNIANALAAAVIAYAQGVSPQDIAQALASFSNSYENSPGRLNVHDDHGFRVIVDYAHNPAGLTALCQVIERLRPRYSRVIGSVSIPGDRRDEDLRQMGAIAAQFMDEVVFRERPDNRGRADGEVCRLMREGALAAGLPPRHAHCIPGEAEAMEACLNMAQRGDLVVLLPTSVEVVWRQVLAFKPQFGDERSHPEVRQEALRA